MVQPPFRSGQLTHSLDQLLGQLLAVGAQSVPAVDRNNTPVLGLLVFQPFPVSLSNSVVVAVLL